MRIGINLGGTKIEGILLDDSGQEQARYRLETPHADYQATLTAVCALVQRLDPSQSSPANVGVGIPGTISPATGLIKNANSTWLIGQPLESDLAERLQRPIRIANDADCFTVSEATDGAGAGARSVFGVILGTGVGGGFCWQGRLLDGPNAIVGEWGHNPLPWPDEQERAGPGCYCGLNGCIETYLSGPGMANDHHVATGKQLVPPDIVAQALGGNEQAEATLQRYEQRLARSLSTIVNILDPDVIVLGGGLSQVKRWYQTIPKLWNAWVFSDRVDTKLAPPKHGDSSGIRGAAWLWPNR